MFNQLFIYKMLFALATGWLSIFAHGVANMHYETMMFEGTNWEVYAKALALAYVLTTAAVLLVVKFTIIDTIKEYRNS